MKLIYLSSKAYPATTADHIYVREMAKALTRISGESFTFVIANDFSRELAGINLLNLGLKLKRGRSLFFCWWIPRYVSKEKLNGAGTVFFTADPNLLTILIFCKKLFGFKYKIVSDWHMLFDDWRDSFIARNSDGLVSTTGHLKGILVGRLGASAEKVTVAYGGVDLSLYKDKSASLDASRSRLNLPANVFLVGYVGFYKTMGMAKGLDTMIGSLALIDDRNVKMVFIGGKPDEIVEYRKMAEEKGVADRAIFVPMLSSTAEVAIYEKAMDVLVIPYPDEPHFREYGFPMKVYEYMASQRPILYSNLQIISEMLGDCAIPFRPGDEKDLALKILDCKNNQTRSRILADKAHDKVEEYTWDKRAKAIVTFLKGI